MIQREDIQFRVGSTGTSSKGDWAMALIYIDARTAHKELDDKFGVGGWIFTWQSIEGHKFAIKGTLKCLIDSKWITREDVGYPQDSKMKKGVDETEVLKDAVSDALKRCAVMFGIGRILYEGPKLYSFNVKKNKEGKIVGFTDIGESEIIKKIDDWYKSIK